MISFSNIALDHLAFWIENDRKLALRIIRIIEEIQRSPFKGIGKPEPLKGDFKGFWSRRIDDEIINYFNYKKIFLVKIFFYKAVYTFLIEVKN